ncbi:hypothetical protein D3C78_481300 [compost metagenome]
MFDLVALSGDDLHGSLVVGLVVDLLEGFVEQVLDPFGVGLVDAEDHRLLVAQRVELLGQLFADDLVEAGGDDPAVEGLDLEVEFVLQLGHVHLSGRGVDDADALAAGEMDAVLAEHGLVADRRLMVDQPIVSHRLAVAVGEHRGAEDLAGVLGRGGSQADAAGVEVV